MGCCTVGSWASPLSVPVRIVSDGNALHSIPSAPIAPSRGAEDVGGVHGRSEGHSPHDCYVHKDAHVNPRWKWRLVIAYDGTKYAASCGFLLSLLGQFSIASWVLRFEVIRGSNSLKLQIQSLIPLESRRLSTWGWIRCGTNGFMQLSFLGWQFQQRPATVQYMVEKALSKFTKLARDELCLVGASRTDAGVHAWGQVAHFVTPFSFDHLESLHAALNGILPADIRVREIAAVRPEFHARYLAQKKTYHYKIYNDPIMDPFQHSYAYHCAHRLSIDAMRQAAKHFIGRHDFSAFKNRSRDGLQNNLTREIFHFDVVKMGANLQLEVEGSGFFYKQVRSMVGLLLEVGKEALPPDIVLDVLASCDRRILAKYAVTAPPYGLCLVSVSYTDTDLEPPTGSPSACFGRHHQISKCIVTYY